MIAAVVVCSAIAIYYTGYVRNENRCADELHAGIESAMATIDRWRKERPDYVTQTDGELLQMKADLAKANVTVAAMSIDQHRHACDVYLRGFTLSYK
ncbi:MULTISPECIES: hypothetical protein [unclassified Phaeobacter]|uniref:hypothetical protein n=1 Tax=unclassified Phaeobacter TaxID=2621772 RepID=UPI003A8AD675